MSTALARVTGSSDAPDCGQKHYAGTRRALWLQKTLIEGQVAEAERAIGCHTDELMKERTRLEWLKSQAQQMEIAAKALGAMDDANLVMSSGA